MFDDVVRNLNHRTDHYHSIYVDRIGDLYRLRIIGCGGYTRITELMDTERMMDCLTWVELGMSISEGW